jgi:signal transduction histidine kinase
MTSPPPPEPDGMVAGDVDARLVRLERRWRRERDARLESERIAEMGLRRLWDAKNELDGRVEERTVELRVARAAAEAADAAKTEFLSNLSHEVRTPLQTIVAALELAQPARPSDRVRLDEAQGAANGLCQLFSNLLELAQCDVGSIDVVASPTDLDQVADELADRWRDRLTARGLLLVPQSGGRAVVDRVRLVQIGDALLDNAVKFARPGTIRLDVVRTDDRVQLSVADDGPGVDPGALERIFEPFVQLEGGNDRTVGGAGIGLALVQGLTLQLGGTTTASPSETGGLAVSVRIPAEHLPDDDPARSPTSTPGSHP